MLTHEDVTIRNTPPTNPIAVNKLSSSSGTSDASSPSVESPGLTDGEDFDENAEYWLLCAVVCSGKNLFVGEEQLGDLFCMLHTSDGVCRSRTAVTGMVYSNANPVWPSNGNGNAFVLPVRRSKRQTDLVITIWDGSESLEEAIPVGKVHINLKDFMQYPSVPNGNGQRDSAPPRYEFKVELVPRLASVKKADPSVTVMLERASHVFEGDGAKDQALHDLLRRLGLSRRKDRLKRLMQWDREYPGHGMNKSSSQTRDYSLVALLTDENSTPSHDQYWIGGNNPKKDMEANEAEQTANGEVLENNQRVEGMMEKLANGNGNSRLVSVPVRAQAELLSRIKHVALQDGNIVMAKGTSPTSFFYIVKGACLVTVDGEEVSRIDEGQFLGEIGVIYDSARIADVRAVGDTELLVLSGDDLWLAIDMFPGLFSELTKVAEMRFEHVQSRKDWGIDKANVDVSPGPLKEFLFFLKEIAADISKHNSQKSKASNSINFKEVQIRDEFSTTVEETSKPSEFQEPDVTVSMPPLIDTQLDEQALSARLKSMEQSGAFGPVKKAEKNKGIKIPKHLKEGQYNSHGSSLRGAVMPMLGSLEYARKAGGLTSFLSPQGSRWDHISSSDSEESESGSPESVDGSETNNTTGPSSYGTSEGDGDFMSGSYTGECKDFRHDSESSSEQANITSAANVNGHDRDKPRAVKQQKRKPRPRKTIFRIRFRKLHDTYTAEELGATPRRLWRLSVSGVYVQSLKEYDINAYYLLEGRYCQDGNALIKSDVTKGDKSQQEVSWPQLVTIDLEEESLLPNKQLRFSVHQKRQLWSDKVVGYALADVSEAMKRPGVAMQSTYQLFKDKVKAEFQQDEDGQDQASNASDSANSAGLVRSLSGGNLFGRIRRHAVDASEEDEQGKGRVKGTVTLTMVAQDSVKLPFCLAVPPLYTGQAMYDILDHVGNKVAMLQYIGRSRCAWCTNVDPSDAFYSGFHDGDKGPQVEPCCSACAMKGWSECVVMWDKDGEVRLGSIFTEVTPRKHARARICDQNETHFASVRAICSTKPEICTSVKFKIVPTFSELSIKATGSIITGKTCSSSFQVSIRKQEENHDRTSSHEEKKRSNQRGGDVVADINRGGIKDPANVLVQPGKDAVRSVLIAIGIDEACRLRPKSVYDGVTFKDKFDKEYDREEELPEASGDKPLVAPFLN
uniref:Cyclic nucleotide-binding domain-containing protein n=1 Tax=Hanusia phi TaxID=3032 RepID=A0A7S0E576_9CRYP|mmetsp:Transcript_16257/g.37122  ORF Transcript_16257/g.37122 Transcript_16257/m.37122 type:complete len:1188 (+) Transcript_16257:131-3694(+)